MSDKKYYYDTKVTYNYKKNRKLTTTTFRSKEGNVSSSWSKVKESKISYKGFIAGLFLVSTIMIFGTYFFNKGFNSSITDTLYNETIVNNINGVDYSYDVSYVDYDYTKKLEQLQGLRNVFSLEDFNNEESQLDLLRVPNPDFFSEGGKYSDDTYIINQMVNVDKVCHLQWARFEIGDQGYQYYYLYLDVPVLPDKYLPTYNNYVNSNNVVSWVDYQKSILDSGDYWYDDLVYYLKILNAPFIWLANIIYDVGVVVSFITLW